MPYVFQTHDKKTGKAHARWKFQYRDYLGRKRTGTGTTSRRDTDRLASQIQAQQRAIRMGVMPAPRASDIVRDIDEIVEEYMLWGRTQGGRRGHPWGADHARKVLSNLAFWKKQLKLRTQIDLMETQSRVERVIHKIHIEEGKSGKTAWSKVESLAAFVRWCVDRGYLDEDPLRRLKKINTDPVRRRRPLRPEEITKLIENCLPERRLLYETALCTGLRANELRSLTPSHLDVERCGLRLEGTWTKNRLDGFQPVPGWLMDRLVEHSAGLSPKGHLFMVQKTHPARMVQDDLKRAQVALEIPGEGKLDFHSLRMTYCTLLDISGASAKETQDLARHSTPVITMARYVRSRTERLKGVVDAVGDVVRGDPAPQWRHNGDSPKLRVLGKAS